MNIVFDFGAVLFRWQPTVLVQHLFGHLTPTAEATQHLTQALFHHEDWQDFDAGRRELHEVIERTSSRLSLPVDDLHALMGPIGERLAPIPESLALFEALRLRRDTRGDLRLYFLSNMPIPYARSLERRHGFIADFDGGVFSGDVGLIKPQPEIYQLLTDRHALEPARTVFIDDMAVNVDAARRLGWQAIHCTDPTRLAAQLSPWLPA